MIKICCMFNSVTMTSISTIASLFMMPFNVWLYGRSLETDTLVIPYGKMFISLISLTTPVIIGMVVNWKFPKIAPILAQVFPLFYVFAFTLIEG